MKTSLQRGGHVLVIPILTIKDNHRCLFFTKDSCYTFTNYFHIRVLNTFAVCVDTSIFRYISEQPNDEQIKLLKDDKHTKVFHFSYLTSSSCQVNNVVLLFYLVSLLDYF